MAEPRPGDIFQPGDLLNNTYRVEAVLGRGGTSEVYRARSEISGRVVAVKALRAEFSRNEDYLVLMTREEDIREIRHDAIVRYFDTQRTDDGHVYLVMDYVDGPALDRKLAEGGMPADELLIVARRVAEGLQAAHGRNIAHRDLSPDNIILRGGQPDAAVIIDFGIAKDSNPGAETIVGNEFAGKYAYAAPEQLSGKTDARSDLYALGALLLSTFRGRLPDVGANPMEVIRRKALPLDTEGVPDILRRLIDRLAHPDPDHRFQSAAEVLAFLDRGGDAAPGAPEATVIVPRPKADPPPKPNPAPARAAPPSPPEVPAPARGRGMLVAAGLAVVAALGAGAWFAGLLPGGGPPLADPFVLTVERQADQPAVARGHIPDPEMQTALASLLGASSDTTGLVHASGQIAPDWPADMLKLLELAQPLGTYRLEARNDTVTLVGAAETRSQRDAILAAIDAAPLSGGLKVAKELDAGPLFLSPTDVHTVARAFADCGHLTLIDPPVTGYARDATIRLQGQLASADTRAALTDALAEIAGDRMVRLETEVLNPTLCKIASALPDTKSGGMTFMLGYGDRPDVNASARYFVGENPVIDLVIPETVTEGFLFVSAVDVSGNVFHMLPNLMREGNSIAELRDGQAGPVTVRVAYSLAEAEQNGRLAFIVDDTALGKSRIIAIHADDQIFGGLRPTTESSESYAKALAARSGPIRALDDINLTTMAKP